MSRSVTVFEQFDWLITESYFLKGIFLTKPSQILLAFFSNSTMEIERVKLDEDSSPSLSKADSSETEQDMSFDLCEKTEISLSSDFDLSQMEEEDEEDLISSPAQSDPNSIQEFDGFSKLSEMENQWYSLPNMHTPRYRFASSTINGRIYVFGGSSNSCRLNKAEMYSPETKTWIQLPDMMHKRSGCSSAVIGHNIYVLGGLSDKTTALHCGEIFNTITMAWSSLPSEMSYNKEQHQSVAIGNKIYVFGGYRNMGRGEVFDIDMGYWSDMKPMNTQRYAFGAVAIEGKIYAIGGMLEPRNCPKNEKDQYNRYLETMDVYDTSTDTWEMSSQTMRNRRSGCSVFARGSEITVLGGCDGKELVQAVETYDVSSQRWSGSVIPPFSKERKEHTALLANNDLIIIGGSAKQDSKVTLTSVEIFENVTLLIDTVDAPIPVENKTTNIDFRRKRAKSTTCIRSFKVKRKQPLHKSKRPLQKRSKLSFNNNKKCKQSQRKTKANTLLTKHTSRRIAKFFNNVLHFGTVMPNDGDTLFFITVKYDDGDHEQLDAHELEDALKLYKKEKKHDRRTKKRGTEKAKKVVGKKIKSTVAPMNQGSTLLEDRLQSIQQLLNKRIQKVIDVEEMVFGIPQAGSLQARISKLEESLGVSVSV
jgi:N-acetylneuraminic acid mutarotase